MLYWAQNYVFKSQLSKPKFFIWISLKTYLPFGLVWLRPALPRQPQYRRGRPVWAWFYSIATVQEYWGPGFYRPPPFISYISVVVLVLLGLYLRPDVFAYCFLNTNIGTEWGEKLNKNPSTVYYCMFEYSITYVVCYCNCEPNFKSSIRNLKKTNV